MLKTISEEEIVKLVGEPRYLLKITAIVEGTTINNYKQIALTTSGLQKCPMDS